MGRRVQTVLAACLMFTALLASQIAVSEAGNRTVVLKDIAFTPDALSIWTGSTVTFQLLELDTDHNVISHGRKRFKSIQARTTGSVKRKFTRGGVYRYECTLHPGMVGRITVR